jgi:hypothetical protein
MGHDENDSLLNKYCQSHAVPNLFVVDGSVFPTSAAVNPTLTIQANAYRVAAHIIKLGKVPTGKKARRENSIPNPIINTPNGFDELARRNENPDDKFIDNDPPRDLIHPDWEILNCFADQIIPETNNNPSASAAGFKGFVEQSIEEYYSVGQPFSSAKKYSSGQKKKNRLLRDLEKLVYCLEYLAKRDYSDESFVQLATHYRNNAIPSEKNGAMVCVANLEMQEPGLFYRMRLLVIESYFSDPRHGGNKKYEGWKAINLQSHVIKKLHATIDWPIEVPDTLPDGCKKIIDKQE